MSYGDEALILKNNSLSKFKEMLAEQTRPRRRGQGERPKARLTDQRQIAPVLSAERTATPELDCPATPGAVSD